MKNKVFSMLKGAFAFTIMILFCSIAKAVEPSSHIPDASIDFTIAAERVMDQVVHVKSYIKRDKLGIGRSLQLDQLLGDDFMDEFFGPQPKQPKSNPDEQVATGSGVVIRADGYIVTNNHVIEQADRIEVVMHNNRTYAATVVGTDAATDLAVLKIEASNLPAIEFANSDSVRVGQWVLAAGNPFNLNSTVTAGIVSAKTRNVNLQRNQYAIKSFIQTDAAINPGNSGGALINLQGKLIGINTAIASPTGSYAGYGFAIPSNIVQKVSTDLISSGTVQRGFLGVSIQDVDAALVTQKQLPTFEGVYIADVLENGAAKKAGILVGDVITTIDGSAIRNSGQLQENIARHKPGDVVEVQLYRAKKQQSIKVTLTNQQGSTSAIAKGSDELLMKLGIETEALSPNEAKELSLAGGVRVLRVNSGILKHETEMKDGFIITKIDKKEVHSPEELLRELKEKEGGVLLEGRYADKPAKVYYGFGM